MQVIHNFLVRFILLTFTLLSSCQSDKFSKETEEALLLAGDNRKELIKVIRYYKKDPKDSLKLKAAYYLINNIRYHSFNPINTSLTGIFDVVKEQKDNYKKKYPEANLSEISRYTKKKLEEALDSLSYRNQKRSKRIEHTVTKDIDIIDANYLIENIDLAFEAYQSNPLKLCADFQDFLHFVIPYRANFEPLEKGKRAELYSKFKWVQDSLKTNSLNATVKKLYNVIHTNAIAKKHPSYNQPFAISEIEKVQFGTCGDVCSYIVNILRAVGIPAGIDYISKWGIEHNHGRHSWIFYKNKDSIIPLNAGNYRNLQSLYELSSIPRVNRLYFHNAKTEEEQNQTNFYRKAYEIKIPIKWNKQALEYQPKVFLGLYDSKLELYAVATTETIVSDAAYFKEVGNNIVYFPFTLDEEEQILPINHPFELTVDGETKFFNDYSDTLDQVVLLRKYPPFAVRRRKTKSRWIKTLNGLKLQGSNSGKEESYQDLHTLSNFKTTHNVFIPLDKIANYKYYRIKAVHSKRPTNLANFKLVGINDSLLRNWLDVKTNLKQKEEVKKVSDNDALTFISGPGTEITYEFAKKQKVKGFMLQARNDDNHIKIGDTYELFYWDKNWVSLGRQKAIDTVLYYQKVPKGALFTLKNHSRGKEEAVFKFNDNGNQFWVGVSEYGNDDTIYKL